MTTSYPFKIYSSSAGSGKTYTLTKEYLKLALQQDNPAYYKQILAITFTNDAANEMKERILSALKGFSDETSLTESKQKANLTLLQTIADELNAEGEPITGSEIRKRAGRVFRNILHDYSDFAVSTIDSFVNRLVSAFTEELNIPFNYEVDIEAADLLNNAIDRLLNRVGEEEETILSEMLEGYAMEKADEGKSWHYLPDDLAGFGMRLLNERVFEAVGKLEEITLKDFKEVRSHIREYLELITGQVASLADEALQRISDNGLDSKSFVGGSNGIHGYFAKIVEDPAKRITWEPTDAFVRGIEGSDWAPKAVKEAQRSKVNAIAAQLMEYYEAIERLKGEYILLEAILRHFYKLSVIHEINAELTSIKAEKNVVHISDFNKAIINIVLQEPVPFIYERMGERYNHIMIDEFQDTSILQWNNLLPLVENSVAKGHFSMIVGDAKQAIYGWRGGDMEQIVYLSQKRFSDLSRKHQQPELLEYRYETLEYSLKAERLATNYRSATEIIEFNNNLFRLLSGLYSHNKKLLSDVYDAFFEQELPPQPRSGGHIQIDFISKDFSGEAVSPQELAHPYRYNTLDTLLTIIEQVRKEGYTYQDIAILNRSNARSKEIASFLQEQVIDVVSQDSLLLQFARSVQLVIAFFKVMHEPESALNRYEALHLFHTYILGTVPDAAGEEVKEILSNDTTEALYAYLAKKGFSLNPFTVQESGIYELGEKVIQVFSLFSKPRQTTYLFRFLDVVLEFSIKQSNHLADFMEYWELKKEKLCINTPKDWNAITVSSIHKAKGLEYPVVIVPFADWDFVHNREDLLWVSLEKEDLHPATYLMQELPIRSAAISPAKELSRTPLQGQYGVEAEKIFVESLNTLYVALTRPIDRLYLLTRREEFEKKGDTSKINVSYLLYQYITHFHTWDPEKSRYVFEEGLPRISSQTGKTEDEIWMLDETVSADWQDKARLSRKASAIFDPETLDETKDLSHTLCFALGRLKYQDDVNALLLSLQAEGILTEKETMPFTEQLTSLLSHEALQRCFSKQVTILPSTDIICAHALSMPLPDRVVVQGDAISILKFLPDPISEQDKKRLQRYARFLIEMGYTAIEKIMVCTADKSVLVE